jgi:ATP-dependent DNA helicase RecQ
MVVPQSEESFAELCHVITKHWGFRTLRSKQEGALQANLAGRDLLLVLPTGGGKSLCYQAPAAWRKEQVTLVVSPLIALMKDQVDSLTANGIPSVCINSSLSAGERQANLQAMSSGRCRLAFVAPERLVMPDFISFLQRLPLASIAIDEAHCISHWGHDFRPEYRQLTFLKERFPKVPIHGFTATATDKVRHDIIEQLQLQDPAVIVGDFYRSNLIYRVAAREKEWNQVKEFLEKRREQAGIIYCMRRRDVDDLVLTAQSWGFAAQGYHAGMSADQRKKVQDDFRNERCNLIIATVAFGMGIDRPDVRFVLHMTIPKSLEHYQQESGRAGRDGLEAECVVLYHRSDFMSWKSLIAKSAEENGADPSWLPVALSHLQEMSRYCERTICRHRQLVGHFDQELTLANCGACDICLGDAEVLPDSFITTQKLLSAVARCREMFGSKHLIDVLRGEKTDNVLKHQHEQLSVFGLLGDQTREALRDWYEQLAGQGVITRETFQSGQRTGFILKLNAESWKILRGQRQDIQLLRNKKSLGESKRRRKKMMSSLPVDPGLFTELQRIRRNLATVRGVAPFVICHDTTLNALASIRPTTREKLAEISGMGEAKIAHFGEEILSCVRRYSQVHALKTDLTELTVSAPIAKSRSAMLAEQLFAKNTSIEAVMAAMNRAESTTVGYLIDYLRENSRPSPEPWIAQTDAVRIRAAMENLADRRLASLFEHFGGAFTYRQLKIALAWREA